MVSWLQTYAKTHLFYIILIGGAVFSFRVWLSEHDARLKAEDTVKQAQATVADLQKQIDTIPVQTAAKVQVVTKVVHDAVTPSQVVAAIPSLTDLPLATRAIPNAPLDVEVAAQPLMQLAGDDKQCHIELDGEKQTVVLKDAQIEQLHVAVQASKPKFLDKVKHVAEAVGIGIVIGVLLVH